MREIKFRVWDKSKNNWLSRYDWFLTCEQPGISYNSNLVYTWRNFTTMEKVLHNDFIEQQFTGLKDKNGKEIYEGDILSIPDNDPYSTSGNSFNVIEYRYGGFGYVDTFTKKFDLISCLIGESDVDNCASIIGNIFENPELLNEKAV